MVSLFPFNLRDQLICLLFLIINDQERGWTQWLLCYLLNDVESLFQNVFKLVYNNIYDIYIYTYTYKIGASQVAPVVKNLPANEEDVKDVGLIPGLGRSPGGGHGNPRLYSCPENPHEKRSLVGCNHAVTQSLTQLNWLRTHARIHISEGLGIKSITTNKASGGDGIPLELFQILKDDAVKVMHSICQ